MTMVRNVETLTWAVAFGCTLLGGACGSKSAAPASASGGAGASNGGGGGTVGTTSGGTADAAPPAGCPKSALTILFAPMYSAYDGVHTFQIPAVVNGLDPTQITINWSASDPTMVGLAPDPTTGGVLITTMASGTVSIIATAGSLCGVSVLTITPATAQDWMDGSARYNDGVVINRVPRPPRGGADAEASDAATPQQAACTNCHGDTASGPYKTVQHTPEQTGGFSDQDLTNIVENGVVPTGGYFDTSIVSYAEWQTFHKWDVGDSAQGIVVYLRSLAPAAQTGVANFGGRFDGGMRPNFDGGMRPNFDGGRPGGGRGPGGGGAAGTGSSVGGAGGG
jgi:hypothetical protein